MNAFFHPSQVAKDCRWSEWLDWGDCSSCQGKRTRHRIIQQLPTLGGAICDPKNAMEISECDSLCTSLAVEIGEDLKEDLGKKNG
jgi:hypothetical protein